MKRLILIALILIGVNVYAQEQATIENNSNVNIAVDEVNNVFTAPSIPDGNLKSGSKGCDIIVTYTNFSDEQKAAFEYAISIWEENITSPIPINIHVGMDKLADNVLGQGKPSMFLRNFKSTPIANVYFPIALVEKITGKEQNKSNEADISCWFNQSMPWYFGTDGKTPETQYDFVSAILHEIGHGLGISGFFKNENGITKFSNTSNSPGIYDYYIYNLNNQRLADNSIFPCPSTDLTKQVTSNSLVINYTNDLNETASTAVYAPSTWANGISIYHLKKTDFSTGAPNEIMGAYAYKGEAKHNLGTNTLHVLAEIGWGEKSTEIAKSISTANETEILAAEVVNVFPNPCNNTLNIKIPASNTDAPVTIEIFSLTGKTVYKELWSDTSFNPEKRLDLSSLESGIYLVQTTDENAKKFINKIIKN